MQQFDTQAMAEAAMFDRRREWARASQLRELDGSTRQRIHLSFGARLKVAFTGRVDVLEPRLSQ